MSTSKLVADSLWQCLCPSFTSQTLSKSTAILARQRRPTVQCLTLAHPSRHGNRNGKRPSSSARREALVYQNSDSIAFYNPLASNGRLRTNPPTFESSTDLDNARRKKTKFEATTEIRKRGQGERRDLTVENETTAMLYEMTRTQAGLGNTRNVQMIVKHLVQVRKEPPSSRLYSALILSNVDPSEGAAWRVAALLEEMTDQGIAVDVGICHDVLKVLSVHLDYLLRADILDYMRERWLSLNDEGHHHVAAALFREGQLEMGLQKLDEMKRDGSIVRPWLMDLATYTLIEMGEFDDALQMIKDQIAAGDSHISKSVWSFLLDSASAAFSHPATSYCWKSQVSLGYLNPSSGTCLNVLTTASRAGDAALATEIFHILGKRGTVFSTTHYEQLLTTYLSTNPPDLRAALTVLTIMMAVKLEPDTMSTRSLVTFLHNKPEACGEAFDILTSLNEAGRNVPIAALNAVIEAHVHNRNMEQALIVYKALHTFERPSSGTHIPFANVDTFNLLLRGTYRASTSTAHETALFLASEMLALGIQPNSLTYDRLIFVCLEAGNPDHAWRYFDEMDSLDFKPRQGTAAVLAKTLAGLGDARCWDVLQRVQDHGLLPSRMKTDVEQAWDDWNNKNSVELRASAWQEEID